MFRGSTSGELRKEPPILSNSSIHGRCRRSSLAPIHTRHRKLSVLRRAEPLVAPTKPTFRKERLVSPRELRRFLGEPRGSRWAALLKLAGVELKWRSKGKGWRERCGLTRAQCLSV